MASSQFFIIGRWIQVDGTMYKSPEKEITLPSGVTFSDWATENKPTPAVGDPVICSTTFPKSDDYVALVEGCGPYLPAVASDLFVFCTKTKGGAITVNDFSISTNDQWIIDLNAYLAYWFPSLLVASQALGFNKNMARADLVDALAHLINPAVPNVDRS